MLAVAVALVVAPVAVGGDEAKGSNPFCSHPKAARARANDSEERVWGVVVGWWKGRLIER